MGQRGIFLLALVMLVVFLSCSLQLVESRPRPRPQFGYGAQDGYLYKRQSGQDGESDGNAGLESDFDLDSDLDLDLDLSKRSFEPVAMGIRNRRKWYEYIPGVGQLAAKYHKAEGNEEEAEKSNRRGGTIINSVKSKVRKLKDRISEKIDSLSNDSDSQDK